MKCARCGKNYGGIMAALTTDLSNPLCPGCVEAVTEERRATRAEERRREEEDTQDVLRRAAGVILTTTPGVDGRRATAYLGIESVEIVIGTGIFSELSGDLADFLGRRSKAFEGKLREAKELAFQMLRIKAARKGADAVIGVDMDYAEFSGNRVALIVNGTMVRLATESGDEARPATARERRSTPPPIGGRDR